MPTLPRRRRRATSEFACTSSHRRSRTTPHDRARFPSSRARRAIRSRRHRARLRQLVVSCRTGRRCPRHARAAQGARRLDRRASSRGPAHSGQWAATSTSPARPPRPARGRHRPDLRELSPYFVLGASSVDSTDMFKQLGLIGCGLMGGSFALAMKRAGMVKHVVGYSKSPSHGDWRDDGRRRPGRGVGAARRLRRGHRADRGAGVATEATFRAIRHLVKPNALFMDVGSTKGDVVDAARRVLKERVASSCRRIRSPARRWPASAPRREPLPGLQVILTPVAETAPSSCRRRPTRGGRRLPGAHMTPETHDAAFAAVSHLPHLLAFASFLSVAHQPAASSSSTSPARASATSRASRRAIRRSGATS